MLNLFYEEPDPDRWFPGDRYPRRVIRRMVRRTAQASGHRRVFLNLAAGLEKLGIGYRLNDYRYARKHPEEVACIIGKPNVLDKIPWQNPILFGASIFSHPCDEPANFSNHPIRRILVPGEWVTQMWKPFYGDRVQAWPVGIDTQAWQPAARKTKDIDFLLYNKIRWQHSAMEKMLVSPIRTILQEQGYSIAELKYGSYQEPDFHELLRRSRAMIFLCEHETQGIAYQQTLACDVPILAWDRGGYWQDPNFYPDRAQFSSVSSVPYWDDRCGLKFQDITEFQARLEQFWTDYQQRNFAPRDYILDNLTLEKAATAYIAHVQAVRSA